MGWIAIIHIRSHEIKNISEMKWKTEIGSWYPVYLLEIQFYCSFFKIRQKVILKTCWYYKIFWSCSQSIFPFLKLREGMEFPFRFPVLSLNIKSNENSQKTRSQMFNLLMFFRSFNLKLYLTTSFIEKLNTQSIE